MSGIADKTTVTDSDSFRDHISTITKDGKRAWIFPRKPSGKFHNKRIYVSIFLLILLFSGPFIQVNGHPLMLFNILERKFILMGVAFWPQDFHLFGLAMLTFIVFIVLFTALFGRLWCGWACPQTIFMEMVFRKIEYMIEGDYMQQKALNGQPRNPRKVFLKGTKHLIFFVISFIIANTFLAYIIGIDQLSAIINDPPSKHIGGLSALLIFTGIFYWVYAWFREQVCIVACPYGRLQGVLMDKNTVLIGYDYGRGEPRGKLRKHEERDLGDCIDCHQCVQVCPTGIDIRNGTQLECVNCTACLDACDSIMDRIGKPRGLIRYTSENAIAKGLKWKMTPRILGYSVLLGLLLSSLVVLLANRNDIEATVLRTPGMLFQEQADNRVSNLYNLSMVNKTFKNIPLSFEVVDPVGEIKWVGRGIADIAGQKEADGEFFIILKKSDIHKSKTRITIRIMSGDHEIERVKTNFIGPVN